MKLYLKILFSLFLFFPFFGLFAEKIKVCSTCEIKTIKAAISLAKEKDTILIGKGTYKEGNIIVQKSLTILGEGMPILDGADKYEVLTINAKNVIIRGLQIQSTARGSLEDYAGIKLYDSENVLIENNFLKNTFFGIYLANSTNCTIRGNRLEGSGDSEQSAGNGIHAWKCENIRIENNYSSLHRDGIYFEFVTNSFITNNISEKNIRYGLHFMFSHNDEYRKNTFRNNGAGVAVMYTKQVRMYENIFEQNWGDASYGLLLKDISDSEISHNRFRKNTVGIYMEGTNRIEIWENEFSQNGWAVRIQASCMDNTFRANNFISNTFDMATNGTTVLNKLEKNYWDKYEGYDLRRDGVGDVPYRPVSVYAMIVEEVPAALMLFRGFMVGLLDRTEKMLPTITPEALKDEQPLMKSLHLFEN